MDPRTGGVLAASGIGLSGLQPPGSTFKILTATGALEAKLTSPSHSYPVSTKATLEGVDLDNANGESCGGTFVESFAESCNSVFAPLGAQARRAPPGRRRRALRLQPRPRRPGRGDEHDPRGRGDRRRPRGRLVGDRAGARPGDRARDGDRGRDDRPPRPAPAADLRLRRRDRGLAHRARDEDADRAHGRTAHARRRPQRHRRRGGDPRRSRWPARPGPPSSRPPRAASPIRPTRPRARRRRPTTRPTPTRGSRPTPRRARALRASPWASCSWPPAPAGRPPRRPRATSSRPASRPRRRHLERTSRHLERGSRG